MTNEATEVTFPITPIVITQLNLSLHDSLTEHIIMF